MKKILVLAVLFLATPAAAQRDRPARDFDDDSRRGWNAELGTGPWIAGATTWTIGGAIDVGAHHFTEPTRSGGGEKSDWLPTIEGLRWCAAFGCGVPLLLLFAPPDSLLGNEIGVDVRAVFAKQPGAAGTAERVLVRPIFRYASGPFRTATLAGTFLPEIGFAFSDSGPASLALGWTIEAFDVLVDRRHVVLGFEPIRLGVLVPFDGTRASAEIGTGFTLRWIR